MTAFMRSSSGQDFSKLSASLWKGRPSSKAWERAKVPKESLCILWLFLAAVLLWLNAWDNPFSCCLICKKSTSRHNFTLNSFHFQVWLLREDWGSLQNCIVYIQLFRIGWGCLENTAELTKFGLRYKSKLRFMLACLRSLRRKRSDGFDSKIPLERRNTLSLQCPIRWRKHFLSPPYYNLLCMVDEANFKCNLQNRYRNLKQFTSKDTSPTRFRKGIRNLCKNAKLTF